MRDPTSPLRKLPDIRSLPVDLTVPRMVEGAPAPGQRVRQVAREYEGSQVYHALYLPSDWQPGRRYPVIVEYAGNGPYSNAFGDRYTGKVEDCSLGYGISGGTGAIWVCLPYVRPDHRGNQLQWWGDVHATVAYCKRVIPRICAQFGGDPSALILAGFSRGAIACNYIGLHDDEIAHLWLAFVAHSHYDGVRRWDYPGSDRESARRRLQRLHGRAQFISHEGSVRETRSYLCATQAKGAFTFVAIPYRNHTDCWVLRDIHEREVLRDWLKAVVVSAPH